jgi:hypothetical protein
LIERECSTLTYAILIEGNDQVSIAGLYGGRPTRLPISILKLPPSPRISILGRRRKTGNDGGHESFDAQTVTRVGPRHEGSEAVRMKLDGEPESLIICEGEDPVERSLADLEEIAATDDPGLTGEGDAGQHIAPDGCHQEATCLHPASSIQENFPRHRGQGSAPQEKRAAAHWDLP